MFYIEIEWFHIRFSHLNKLKSIAVTKRNYKIHFQEQMHPVIGLTSLPQHEWTALQTAFADICMGF